MKRIDPNALLAHHGWVRALARSLAHDVAGAEDLEQEVWSRALTARPRTGSDLRAWLGGIVRNTAREGWRGESRARSTRQRLAREVKPGQEFGSQRSATESPAQRQERMETYRALLTALTELEEPLSSVVYLRYVDELSIGEIATRLGSPEKTVRTRLRRGLERLRTKTEASLGDDWRARVLILAAPIAKAPIAFFTSGGLALMSLKITLAACAAVVLAAFALGAFDGPAKATNVAHSETKAAVDLEVPLITPIQSQLEPAQERVSLMEEMTEQLAEISAPESEPRQDEIGGVEVTVLDHITFKPLAGAEVWAFDRISTRDREFGRAMFDELLDMEALLLRFGERYSVDANGVALLPERSSYLHIGARAKGVFAAHYITDPTQPTPGKLERVVLHPLPQVHLNVQVYDALGVPVANQRVEYQATFLNQFGQRREWARTDETGLAVFRNMQRSLKDNRGDMTYRIAVPLPGRGGVSFPINPLDPPTEVIVLHLPPLARAVVFVHDTYGTPAPDGTFVHVEAIRVEQDSLAFDAVNSLAGAVRLRTVDGKVEAKVQLGQELVAWCSDRDSGEITKAFFTCPEGFDQTLEVILETGQPTLEARLHVLDSGGRPVQSGDLHATHVSLDGDRVGESKDWYTGTGAEGILMVSAPGLDDIGGAMGDLREGATFLHGNVQGLLRFGWTEWTAGEDAQLILGQELVVAGTVVDDKGAALEDSTISLSLALPWCSDVDDKKYMQVTTDRLGRFEIHGVLPVDATRYSLESIQSLGGHSVQPATVEFEPGQDDLVITLPRLPRISGSVQLEPGIARHLSLRLEMVGGEEAQIEELDFLGRFDFRTRSQGRAILRLLANGQLEVARSPQFDLRTGVEVTPEGWGPLDLRDTLYLHQIDIRAESGLLPDIVTVKLTESGLLLGFAGAPKIVTNTEEIAVSIEASGFQPSPSRLVGASAVFTLVPVQ